MARRSKNNSRRREARRQSAPSNSLTDFSRLLDSRRLDRSLTPGFAYGSATKTRWEPSSRLSSYFKKVAQTRPVVSNDPNVNPSTQKSQKYTQPNWSSVDQKKIEQPRLEPSVCEQRTVRREVLFATNKAGKTGQKTPIWTELSKKVRCK